VWLLQRANSCMLPRLIPQVKATTDFWLVHNDLHNQGPFAGGIALKLLCQLGYELTYIIFSCVSSCHVAVNYTENSVLPTKWPLPPEGGPQLSCLWENRSLRSQAQLINHFARGQAF
jgi:hypothetical protein